GVELCGELQALQRAGGGDASDRAGLAVGAQRLLAAAARLARRRETEAAQQAVEIGLEIIDLRQLAAPLRELNERVMEQVVGFDAIAVGEAERPVAQPAVALDEDLLMRRHDLIDLHAAGGGCSRAIP